MQPTEKDPKNELADPHTRQKPQLSNVDPTLGGHELPSNHSAAQNFQTRRYALLDELDLGTPAQHEDTEPFTTRVTRRDQSGIMEGALTGEPAAGPQRGRGAGGAPAERDESPAGGGRGARGGRGGDCCCCGGSGGGGHEGAAGRGAGEEAGSQRERRASVMGAGYLEPRRSTGTGAEDFDWRVLQVEDFGSSARAMRSGRSARGEGKRAAETRGRARGPSRPRV